MADPRVPVSYYENFLESLARIVSKLLTDRETEAVLSSIRSFQDKLHRMSSQNLLRLQMEATSQDNPQKAPPYQCKHQGKTCSQNCTRGFLKAFAVGFSIKYLIAILPALLTGRVFKRPSILWRAADRDTARFALFLSTFLGSYKGIICLLRRHGSLSERVNSFIAGAIAGMALMIDRDKRRRQSIMLYLLTRSLQFTGAWCMKQWAIHRQEKKMADQQQQQQKGWDDHIAGFMQRWAGVGVMMLASSELMYALLFHQETMPKSYYSFLLTHAGWRSYVGKMAAPLSVTIGETINALASDPKMSIHMPSNTTSREFIATHVSPSIASVIPPGIRHHYIMCALQHPLEASCTHDKINLFRGEFARAFKLYFPLNVIMTAVFRSGQIVTQPSVVLRKFLRSCLQSTIFLAMYVTMGLASPCAMRPILGKERPWMYLVPGAVGGAMTFIEAPARQLELGMYCLPRALESGWNILVKSGYARNLPFGDVGLFMLAMGTLMTMYQNDKDTISPHYLSVMTRFFGNN
ncbi:hypothetical protein LRAMOSA10893 [Lichtheimia ramosa]|uniref:Transmembrane protein 135 N-terminal domain-containing protein n=1 Tax=Lichtheimia ramosa TaxID=688394 RepID=A0A077WR12_9FUNG|nr:hypothetical protein LRAMOSA10893 [Lichtheimia ramosa]